MKERRISTATDVRRLLTEQINNIRKSNLKDMDKARTIGYLSNIVLTAIKDGELEERVKEIEKKMENKV